MNGPNGPVVTVDRHEDIGERDDLEVARIDVKNGDNEIGRFWVSVKILKSGRPQVRVSAGLAEGRQAVSKVTGSFVRREVRKLSR